ncbi:MAG: o-succinylbenzoate synthase [Muribaculaceae bacterium]|nr:o-succinylbenzoate synthase [Muribaculaceae bacterium]
MLLAKYKKYNLQFRNPAITSRATMLEKETYFIKIWDETNPNIYGIGECAIFRGLSADDDVNYEAHLKRICDNINQISPKEIEQSSIRFGVETALNDLANNGQRIIFNSNWLDGYNPIPINGLVWMGNQSEMLNRIIEKIEAGFSCIKLKIGGIDFNKEIKLLRFIRGNFSADDLQIRLDANGAFAPENALEYLDKLSKYSIHSIEQPIKQGQWSAMAEICQKSPIPIALDEELIGINEFSLKDKMLSTIKPHYIILKPSLCGGFWGSNEWIELANKHSIGWWITSALESNIGLNAIAQWVATLNTKMPQGLGTGNLYINNIPSPICQIDDVLTYDKNLSWQIPSEIL